MLDLRNEYKDWRKRYTLKIQPLDIDNLRKKSIESQSKVMRRRSIKRLKILRNFNYQCVNCQSKENLTFDHYKKQKRMSSGKKNRDDYSIKNCKVLCVECHYKKNFLWEIYRKMQIQGINEEVIV